ncbi:MAG: hypothetical protein HY059_14885 [Proteobacteria bacterium]|nr:hypothetical protein [Pseudomonadota bacterium]
MRTAKFLTAFGLVAALSVAGFAMPAAAQQGGVNIRGTIAAIDAGVLTIATRDGKTEKIELAENVPVATTKPFSMAEVKPGMVLAATTMQRADGRIIAIDLRPIPATANQGLSPYDLQPGSTMTNAALDGMVQSAAGQELTLNYKTGIVKVLITPATAMSQSAPGTRADLKVGETVYIPMRPDAAGKLAAVRVQVSKDGVKPTQ